MSTNIVSHLSQVPKHEIMNNRKLQGIIRQGTKIGEDKQKSISTITQKHDYPDPSMKK